jgi:fatty acid desaturase
MTMLDTDNHRDYVWRQVVTSRNIRSGRIVDFIFGGLNLQIEHHLFPTMPRSNLRRAQPIIRQFCQQHGLTYTETSLVDSYAQVLSHLHTVGSRSTAETQSV